MEKEELLEKIEKRHEINTESGDLMVWVFKEPQTQETAEAIVQDLDKFLPGQQHVVIDGLEEIYSISPNEEAE